VEDFKVFHKYMVCYLVWFVLTLPVFGFTRITQVDDFVLEELHRGERYWGMTVLPNQSLLLTEFKQGNLLLVQVEEKTVSTTRIPLNLTLETRGQGGLYAVVLHPNFAQNSFIYFTYALHESQGAALVLARGRWQNNSLHNIETLYRTPVRSGTPHFSGAIVFNNKNQIYLASGERGNRYNSQNMANPFGKILRLNDDGTIPQDNPFFNRAGAAKEIYALGIRNTQGLFFDKTTGILWGVDQGPQGGDELNIIEAGKNYGWPEATTGEEYGGGVIGVSSKLGMADPVRSWSPSPAFSSMTFYHGRAIPSLSNKILVGSLRAETLFVLTVSGRTLVSETRLLGGVIGRIRHVYASEHDHIYLLNDAGKLYRLAPLPLG
jgi:glucose/arabinose dehydrogenase